MKIRDIILELESKINMLSTENRSLEKKLKETENERILIKAELDSLKKMLTDDSYVDERDELRKENEIQKKKISELQKENKCLKVDIGIFKLEEHSNTQKINELEDKLLSANSEIESLNEAIANKKKRSRKKNIE